MRILAYIGLTFFLFSVFYGIEYYIEETQPTVLTDQVIQPDIFLANTRLYYEEAAPQRSMTQLKLAIQALKELKREVDEESKKKINASILTLEEHYQKMEEGRFRLYAFNEAAIKALNALTYLELKATEKYVEQDDIESSKIALRYAMRHVKNALSFSRGQKKDYEVVIYSQMDSIVASNEFTNKEIILKLEAMIEDLDNLGLRLE